MARGVGRRDAKGFPNNNIRRGGTARPAEPENYDGGKRNVGIGGGRSGARASSVRRRRSGTETTLPARIAAAEQSMRQPVEFSPFAGGGRRCQRRHRCLRTPYTPNAARQEIGDTAGERASAPVRHRSRGAGVINKYMCGGHQTARPIRFCCGISSPHPPPTRQRVSLNTACSVARTYRSTDGGRRAVVVCTRTYAEQRRRATATARTENPVRVLLAPLLNINICCCAGGRGRRDDRRVLVGVHCYYCYYYYYYSLTKQPLQHVSLPPPPPQDRKRAYFSGRTANTRNPRANNYNIIFAGLKRRVNTKIRKTRSN